ncbi:pyridoxal phosphate enzyme (YggS family) [Bacillus mesophilus]|uniref:Pyridoxal phosphate homeostasis protein n=1 Tax=Bacillus mesophilus TaxID=1808955 RepID=A0A6M0Q1U0_9BACI|nr:YggS family pyridoxal phosphate-dependent enzyme [Bacillus mesophilus]MBM7659442.1 pyridoxal phosphate enzyme (YggS family) [Bacillus mesophilus]NEY70315.1 YggS family pyridoxal phosphate-dependent enzyme [Bacillus mesophilus]
MTVKDNLNTIQQRIEHACSKANRNPGEIKLIAVTKYVTVEQANEALQAGVLHIGENRDEGLLQKKKHLGEEPKWHFIGSLQTRKVKNIINEVDYIHSLDRISLAEELNKRANHSVKCFVQVNTSGEESKHGMSPDHVVPFIKELAPYQNIHVVGLMTMAPNTDDETVIRECFARLRDLKKDVQALKLQYASCEELSMGMSNDFELAIEEGATFIRVGTSLFE